MTDLQQARASFPLMPAEVFEAWLAPLIESDGWPFLVEKPFRIGNWSRYLLERTPAEWAAFTWRFATIDHVKERLSKMSRETVMHLQMHGLDVGGVPDCIIRHSKDRYWQAKACMVRLKGFPGFVTAYEDSCAKLWVVDGHHRLAALASFPGYKAIKVPFWIARRP